MLIIFACFLTVIFAKSHHKHIEKLPDNQKQVFLANVARKVMEQIGKKEVVKTLKKHDVHKVDHHDAFIDYSLPKEPMHMGKYRRNFNSHEFLTNTEESNSGKDTKDNENNSTFNEDSSLKPKKSEKTSLSTTEFINSNTSTETAITEQAKSVDTVAKIEESKQVERSSMISKEEISNTGLENSETSTLVPEIDTLTLITTTASTKTTIEVLNHTNNNALSSEEEDNSYLESEVNERNTARSIILLDVDHINETTVTESTIQMNNVTNTDNGTVENKTDDIEMNTTDQYVETSSSIELNSKSNGTTVNSLSDITHARSIFIDIGNYPKHTKSTLPVLHKKQMTKVPNQTRFKKISGQGNVASVNNAKDDKNEPEPISKQTLNQEAPGIFTIRDNPLEPYHVYEIPWPDRFKDPFVKSGSVSLKNAFNINMYLPNYIQSNSSNHTQSNASDKSVINPGIKSLRKGNIKVHMRGHERKFGAYTRMHKNYRAETMFPAITITRTPTTTRSPAQEEFDAVPQKITTKPELEINNMFLPPPDLSYLNKSKSANSNDTSDLTTISGIMMMTDEADVFPVLEKLQQIDFKLRRNDDTKLSKYLKALNDLVEQDSDALKRYDWLATTVRIQSALAKMFQLIDNLAESKPLHPADVQILKYVIFLHNFAKELKNPNRYKNSFRTHFKNVASNKNHVKFLDKTELLAKVWRYLRKLIPDLADENDLYSLTVFFLDVENSLYDLHEVIKSISNITTYRQQNWFENLKQLYLTTDEKHLRELLLHISFSKLVELVEHSCENGLEDGFTKYMKTHKTEAKNTLQELLFVSRIIEDIKVGLEEYF